MECTLAVRDVVGNLVTLLNKEREKMEDFICKRVGGLIAWVITFFILKYSIIFALFLSDIDPAHHIFWITVISVVVSFIKISMTFGFNDLKEQK